MVGRARGHHVQRAQALISVPPGSSVFVDLLWPPTELRGGAEAVGSPLQGGAVGQLGVFELLDAGEMPVDEHVVGQRPEMLSRLPLGRVRRQEHEVDVVGHREPRAGVPARAVKDQDDLLAGAGADGVGKGGQFNCEQRDTDRGSAVEARAARGGVDEADELAPGEAVAHHGDGSVPFGRPDSPQERLEPDAVLVGGPQFDRRLGMGSGHRAYQRANLFLNSACCSASARTCRGRGTCRLCFRRCR
jgi:hypothetical protein